MPKYLIFVDTNIFLDFYRVRKESGLKLLEKVDDIHDSVITTYQVEMEFKKNRQAVLLESLKNLKTKDKIGHVAFLAESKYAEAASRQIDSANTEIKKLQQRLKTVLANPTTSDPVYKVVQRLFADDHALNLNRSKKIRQEIKRHAFRRFMLGYPPRKPNDTSIGDALNWEWIVHISKETGCNVAIVSRDSDYGVEVENDLYINNWLLQEFRDRVSKKRQCRLFNRLAPAYKLAGISVAKSDENEEKEELELARETEHKAFTGVRQLASQKLQEYLEKALREAEATLEMANKSLELSACGSLDSISSVCMNWKYASESGRQLNSMLCCSNDVLGSS
jgi:hypothetical protein